MGRACREASAPQKGRTIMGLLSAIGRGHVYHVGADDLVINSRNSLRGALRAAGLGVAGGGAAVAVAVSQHAPGDALRSPAALIPAGAGGAVAATTVLIKPQLGRIVQRGLTTQGDAVRAADALNRSAGVVPGRAGGWDVADISSHYDLDHLDPARLRIGDGSVRFEALVTQDGDLLRPVGVPGGRGYANQGAAAPPLDLRTLDPADADAVEQALRDRQLGTDDDHHAARVGAMLGDRRGYATEREAADALLTASAADRAFARVGSNEHARWFGFDVLGPRRWEIEARGLGLRAVDDVRIGADKALWAPTAPGRAYAFDQRVLPFEVDDPVGKRVRVAGVVRTPDEHVGTFGSHEEAIREAARRGGRGIGSRRVETAGYLTLEAATPNGAHHVYRQASLTGASGRPFEPELGRGRSAQWKDVDERTEREGWGDRQYEVEYQRETLVQRESSGRDREIGNTGWVETGRRRLPRSEPGWRKLHHG